MLCSLFLCIQYFSHVDVDMVTVQGSQTNECLTFTSITKMHDFQTEIIKKFNKNKNYKYLTNKNESPLRKKGMM